MNILITGASRGIGLATAKQLAKKGHNVGLFATNTATLEQAIKDKSFKKSVKKHQVITGQLDVTQPNSWDNAINQMLERFGGIDVLINNTGVLVSGALPTTDLDEQLSLIDVNCKGVLIGCHKLAPYLADSNDGKIINVSSASAIYGQPEVANYAASKFFVRGLTEGLNIEYAKQSIKVIDVMPLWVKSDMTADINVTSVERLGINLTVNDVAKTLCKLTTRPNRKLKSVHYTVGMPAKAFQTLAQITPNPLIRWVNTKIGAK
ncbi:SDR family NAD(P)-dependent oxidoreductase [Psychrobacter sp. 1176_08]|uniref:SDR family NAD(P)-dependent oxidoreductase n=1 Tax=Psychrobacter sp. 1176_08 TaxID=2604452 RepID=UPI0040633A2F